MLSDSDKYTSRDKSSDQSYCEVLFLFDRADRTTTASNLRREGTGELNRCISKWVSWPGFS